MKTKYSLNKKNKYKKLVDINISESLDVSKKIDKESIGLIKFYDEKLINNVIKKKMDVKFKQILELLIREEESDEDPSEGLMICLTETGKLKEELRNKYRRFLKKEQQELLEKKVMLLEEEIKVKLFNIQMIRNPFMMNPEGMDYEEEETEEKETRRRR